MGAIQELLDRLVALEIARLEAAIKALDGPSAEPHTHVCGAASGQEVEEGAALPLTNLPEGQTVVVTVCRKLRPTQGQ